MKNYGIAALVIVSLLGAGCASRDYQANTPAPPSGPIQTNTHEPGVIPAGTTYSIGTNQEITNGRPGQTYSAQVEQDIMDQSGRLLVPKGSPSELVIVETSEAGTVGTASMELAIRSVTVSGKNYPIATGSLKQRGEEGLGTNPQDGRNGWRWSGGGNRSGLSPEEEGEPQLGQRSALREEQRRMC